MNIQPYGTEPFLSIYDPFLPKVLSTMAEKSIIRAHTVGTIRDQIL